MIETRVERGWVVVGPKGGLTAFEYAFGVKRRHALASFRDLYIPTSESWKKLRRRGFRCVRATRTVTIEEEGR